MQWGKKKNVQLSSSMVFNVFFFFIISFKLLAFRCLHLASLKILTFLKIFHLFYDREGKKTPKSDLDELLIFPVVTKIQ